MISRRLKKEGVYMEKLSCDQFEELIVQYFDYLDKLNKEIRILKVKIKEEKEKLLNEESRKYKHISDTREMVLGKGEYISLLDQKSDLRFEIINQTKKEDFDKIVALPDSEIQKMPRKLGSLILEYRNISMKADKMKEEYENSERDNYDRNKRIETHKKNIKNNKNKLKKKEKEKNKYFEIIKSLDKQISRYRGQYVENADKKEINSNEEKKLELVNSNNSEK